MPATPEPVRNLPPGAVLWLFWLAALSFLAAASASALTLSMTGLNILVLPVSAWFLACFYLVWWKRGEPDEQPQVRRVVDILAVIATLWFVFQLLLAVSRMGAVSTIPLLGAQYLMILQVLRAPIITTARDAEGFLFASLILAVFCSTTVEWQKGAPLLVGFIWIWLSAMVMARLVGDTEKRLKQGAVIASGGGADRVLMSGIGLAFMTSALAVAVFIPLHGIFTSLGIREGGFGFAGKSDAGGRGVDYSKNVDLRGWSDDNHPPQEVAHIRAPASMSLFRIQSYDTLRDTGWEESNAGARDMGSGRISIPDDLGMGYTSRLAGLPFQMEVTVVQESTSAVLTAERPGEVEVDRLLSMDFEGGIRAVQAMPAGITYVVRGKSIDWEHADISGVVTADPGTGGGRYLDTSGLSQPVRDLAWQWTGGAATPWLKAVAIASTMRTSYSYSHNLTFKARESGLDIIDCFIGDKKAGSCINFASALVMMLRSVGVPSRLAVGYLAGNYDSIAGEWIIKSSEGHAWSEVLVSGFGWIPLDSVAVGFSGAVSPGGATASRPGDKKSVKERGGTWNWRGWAVAILPPIKFQSQPLDYLSVFWPYAVAMVVLSWILANIWQSWRQRVYKILKPHFSSVNPIQHTFLQVCAAAANRGYTRRPAQTAMEFCRHIHRGMPELGPDVLKLGDSVTALEYGDNSPSAGMIREIRQLGERLVAAMRK